MNVEDLKALKMNEDKLFLLEYIEFYRSLTALWNRNAAEYNDRNKKEEAYELLTRKYQERYPKANRKQAIRKMNVLRTNYKRALKKMKEMKKDVEGNKRDINTTLWYFDAINFIGDTKAPNKTYLINRVREEPKPNKIKKRKVTEDDTGSNKLITLTLKEPTNEFTKASEIWAIKLQKMDRYQSLIAEKMINTVIFYGQMGQLDMNASFNPGSINSETTPLNSSTIHSYETYESIESKPILLSPNQLTANSTTEDTETILPYI